MEELARQSAIADRPVALLELSKVQRDANYEETKLMVIYKHGREALTAFDRQRRMPALYGGSSLFLTGIVLSLATYIFEAPVFCLLLGFGCGVLPGLTIAGLALLPGDDAIIEKVMRVLTGVGVLFGCLYIYRALPLVNSLLGVGYDTCIDYQGTDAPCWVSAIHVALYCALAMLTVEIVGRRLVINLYYKRDIGGRLDFIWRNWALWLIGFAIISTTFLLPYLFYTTGHSYLLSAIGIVDILTTVELAALGKFSFTKKWYTEIRSWLAEFGTITDAMAVATLMSQGGDKPLEEVMATAKAKLRYVTLSSMDASAFDVSGGGRRSYHKYAKSVRGRPRDIDLFVSHSWSDAPLEKWKALQQYCSEFEREHNREARLWVDIFCLDPDAASEPQYHPVYMMSAERLMVLKGPTFDETPWCACELLMWVESGGSISSIDSVPIVGRALSAEEGELVDPPPSLTSQTPNPESAFQFALLEVVRACGSAAKFNQRVACIIRAISESGETGTMDAAVRVRSRRLSGTILLAEELGHLTRQFEKMKPGCWW